MRHMLFCLVLLFSAAVMAQTHSKSIIVDQFGYLPESRKLAVIKDPKTGFDSTESFVPGKRYSLVNVQTGNEVFAADITAWADGGIDASSGDRAWHFDFSAVESPGTYFVLDNELQMRSFEFKISEDVYNEVLKHAVRTFYYQRAGFIKEAQFAGEAWADGSSHLGELQDKNCRSFFDKDNPDTEKDVSGGWYDAGDFNKYTSWTANYIVEMMKAWLERPGAWTDDYNIPESGNGIPDLLDEARWAIDHLLRLQQEDGSVLSIVGESHASPPSAATGPSYYGPVNTSATLNARLITSGRSNPFSASEQEVLLYYSAMENGTKAVQETIREAYKNSIINGEDNLPAYTGITDPYLAHIRNYTWGSNSTKSSQGNMYYDMIAYGIDEPLEQVFREAAQAYVHYIHGVNPLNMVYLSNMYSYGGDNCVNEFYHSWFCNGSEKWDRVGESSYGPPPGYLTGGPNPRYNWDRCCPEGCNGEANNDICLSEPISPPRNQPAQKSYKDFNTSWPLNSWEITENSCSYQCNYIRLLSKFVKIDEH